MILQNIEENYGNGLVKNYKNLEIAECLEKHGGQGNTWGDNLTLSLIDTIKYCSNRKNCFVPSTGLWVKIYLEALKNVNTTTKSIIFDLDNYWLRTFSVISFPTDGADGQIVHYPLADGDILKTKNGKIDGEIVVEFSKDEMPPLGTQIFLKDHLEFFDKILGQGIANQFSDAVKTHLNYYPSIWFGPEISITTAPNKLFIFGGLKQYGQGLWLTGYSTDKTLVGTRPFRCVRRL